jgi:hypothetical protein
MALAGAMSKAKKQALSEKKILELGRKHFAGDFPSAKREGCPAKRPQSHFVLLTLLSDVQPTFYRRQAFVASEVNERLVTRSSTHNGWFSGRNQVSFASVNK